MIGFDDELIEQRVRRRFCAREARAGEKRKKGSQRRRFLECDVEPEFDVAPRVKAAGTDEAQMDAVEQQAPRCTAFLRGNDGGAP